MKRFILIGLLALFYQFGFSVNDSANQNVDTTVSYALQDRSVDNFVVDTPRIINLGDTATMTSIYTNVNVERLFDDKNIKPILNHSKIEIEVPNNMKLHITYTILTISIFFLGLTVFSTIRISLNQYYRINNYTSKRFSELEPPLLTTMSYAEPIIYLIISAICYTIHGYGLYYLLESY